MKQKLIQVLADVKMKMKKMETENLYYLKIEWKELSAQKLLLEKLLNS